MRLSDGPIARELNEVRIRPRQGWLLPDLAGVWRSRELVLFLAWRDVRVRYKHTALGAAWAIIQPMATMLLFLLVFSRLAGVPSDGVPYPVFAFAGLLQWQFFAHALTDASNSLVANERLLTKVYFPRLALPTASILTAAVDVAIAGVGLGVLMAIFRVAPSAAILAAPLAILLAMAAALAVGLSLAALNVQYRDVRYTLPLLSQAWLLATPIAYPLSVVPAAWRPLFGLNPMAGAADLFRWSVLGTDIHLDVVLTSIAVTAVLLVGGLTYFSRMERTFADVI